MDIIPVDLAQPRSDLTREDPRYYELVTRVRETLRRRDTPQTRAP